MMVFLYRNNPGLKLDYEEHSTEIPMPAPITVPLHLTIDAVLHQDPDGGYTAEVPALAGCYSEGDTLESAKANIREAAAAWLAAAHDHAIRAAQPGAA